MAALIDLLEDALSGDEENGIALNAPPLAVAVPKLQVQRVVRKARTARIKKDEKDINLTEVFSAQPETMMGWLFGRRRYPDQFSYTPDGNLQVPTIFPGDGIRVIPVPNVQPATAEYTNDFFKTKRLAAKEQEEKYVQAKRDLKKIVLLYTNGGATIDEVLNKNREVATEDHKLNEILKCPRKIGMADGVLESGLTMNVYDKAILADPVKFTTYTTFPMESMWMTALEPEVAAPQPLPLRQLGGSESKSKDSSSLPKREYTPQQLAIIRANTYRK